MKSRKLLLGMGLFLSSMGCMAQDVVTVTTAQGEKIYQIEDILNMTFEADKMVVNKADGTTADTYNLAEITEVTFDMATTGIDNVTLADSKLTLYSPAGSNIIYIKGYEADTNYDVNVYGINGELVMANRGWKGEPVDVSPLPKGVYVVKINNTTIKIRK